MSKKFFEELGKKLDVFVENSEKDMEGFKKKAEEFAKEAEQYVESVAKDIEPIINDIKEKFEPEIPKEKTFVFNIRGDGKYKLIYSSKESTLTVSKKGSERKFILRLDNEVVTKNKMAKLIDSAVVNKKENTITITIKKAFLLKSN